MDRCEKLSFISRQHSPFDLVVIGGGITGAGVAREAAAAGLRTLLIEQRDFSWGTSSRSSKMVHGGLRYLGAGHIRLTRDAVRERQRMLKEAPGLVDQLQYALPHYRGVFPGPFAFNALLGLYDLFAGQRYRKYLPNEAAGSRFPYLQQHELKGVSLFSDAITDDSRLVIRVLDEADQLGAVRINYLRATQINRLSDGSFELTLEDTSSETAKQPETIRSTLVVNATGAWASHLRPRTAEDQSRIRPLRGSHIVVPSERLPVSASMTILHPDDQRPIFVYPWLGRTVIGTTDLDHGNSLNDEPVITWREYDYLLKLVSHAFPQTQLTENDVISSWSGVRPIVTTGDSKNPSQENREHVIWDNDGLITVSGGKLTTFRRIGREVLEKGSKHLKTLHLARDGSPVFPPVPNMTRPEAIREETWHRLRGHYGRRLPILLRSGPLEYISDTDYLWAELRYSCRHEDICHLDDLMLRRTRLGLILREGGIDQMDGLRHHCKEALGWSEDQWQNEVRRYMAIYNSAYSLPNGLRSEEMDHKNAANLSPTVEHGEKTESTESAENTEAAEPKLSGNA